MLTNNSFCPYSCKKEIYNWKIRKSGKGFYIICNFMSRMCIWSWQVAQLFTASSPNTEVVGSISSQGTYKNEPMNAWKSGITSLSLSLSLSLSQKERMCIFIWQKKSTWRIKRGLIIQDDLLLAKRENFKMRTKIILVVFARMVHLHRQKAPEVLSLGDNLYCLWLQTCYMFSFIGPLSIDILIMAVGLPPSL